MTWTVSTRRQVRALVGEMTQLDNVSPDVFRAHDVANEARALLPRLAERKAPPKPGRQ